jgi:O-antigen/teichoic acid export membrane protein
LVVTALIGSALAVSISIAMAWHKLQIQLPGYRFSAPSRSTYARLLRFGIYNAVNSASAFLLYHIQRYVVGAFLGPAALAAFQVAQTVPAKAHALVNSGAEILFPRASSNAAAPAFRQSYLRVLLASVVLASSTLIPLWVFGEPLFRLWVGREVAVQAVEVLGPMIVGYFMVALSPAPYHVLNGTNRPHVNTIAWASCALLNVILLFAFSSAGLSLMSVAMAFAVSNVVVGICYQAYAEYVLWREPRTPN